MQWVYSVPAWLVSICFIGGCSALAAGGLLIVDKRRAKHPADVNDVAGPVMATIGTILAVMLSFMVVTVWQEYDQAAAAVQTEVDAIDNLYDEVSAFPPALRFEIRSSLVDYTNTVVHQEWHLMRTGGSSPQAHRIAARIVALVESYDPTTPGLQNAQADALTHAHEFSNARGARLFENRQAVPPLLWLVMIFVAAMTLASVYFFTVASKRWHMVMTIAVGAVIGAIFVVIAELDLPFRGDLQIAPSAFAESYEVFADAPPVRPGPADGAGSGNRTHASTLGRSQATITSYPRTTADRAGSVHGVSRPCPPGCAR
jgi:hypothetical protein